MSYILRYYMKLVKKYLTAQIIKALSTGTSIPESERALTIDFKTRV